MPVDFQPVATVACLREPLEGSEVGAAGELQGIQGWSVWIRRRPDFLPEPGWAVATDVGTLGVMAVKTHNPSASVNYWELVCRQKQATATTA